MNTHFIPFELEAWQSRYEQTVAFNLADSGVRPLTARALLDNDDLQRFLDLDIHYPEVNGTRSLREQIAALDPAVHPDQVLVTVGAAEANQLACQTLLQPGDEVVVMEPGYRQVWGLAQNLGCSVQSFQLRAENGWRVDLDELAAKVSKHTRLIALVNPNNPTGSILSRAEMAAIVEIAERSGAWLLADEVYRGTERLSDTETPTFWGMSDRVITVNSLSKAYGLSGLRLGWVIAPLPLSAALWRRHEYATIASSAHAMFLAELALRAPTRQQLLARQRQLIRDGWQQIESWVASNCDLVSVVPAQATALAFVRYELPLPSVAVAEHIRQTTSVLVAPGATLGSEQHLRITHGLAVEYVATALTRIADALRSLKP